MFTDIEIAQKSKPLPIFDIAKKLGISSDILNDEAIECYGRYKAKLTFNLIKNFATQPDGKLILVTAISPTPAGEGKTTTTVGLGDALNRIGKNAVVCIREPSLGP